MKVLIRSEDFLKDCTWTLITEVFHQHSFCTNHLSLEALFSPWYFEVICSQVSAKLTKQKFLPETESLSWPNHYWADIQRLFFMQIHVPNHIYTCAHSPVLPHSVQSQIRDYMEHLRSYSFWHICVLLINNIRVYKEKQGVILYSLGSGFVLIPSPLNTAVKGMIIAHGNIPAPPLS